MSFQTKSRRTALAERAFLTAMHNVTGFVRYLSTMPQSVRNYPYDVNTGNVDLEQILTPRASSPNGQVR